MTHIINIFIRVLAQLIQAGKRAYERKWSFLVVFVMVFLVSVLVLARLGLLPEKKEVSIFVENNKIGEGGKDREIEKRDNKKEEKKIEEKTEEKKEEIQLPIKIEIAKVGILSDIVNPTTTDIAALDKELLKGAVRYPTSAKLGEVGNMVLFGHSSYLPAVQIRNKAFKTFNEIQKLAKGDVITIYTAGTAYVYKVSIVEKKNALSADGIMLTTPGKVLTLVTCNSFALKEDRFVVSADFVESHLISN